jgi:hypothetical protein
MPPESTDPRASSHWLPSIPATVFIGILTFVIFGFQEPLLNSDGDLARHLRHGEWMLSHHHLNTADPFSYTRQGQPFVGFEYGSQLLYTLADRAGGLAGVTVLAALLLATCYALLARFLLRRRVDPLLAGVTISAAIISGTGHWLARPHLITMVAVPILLELLVPVTGWRLWPFPVLFAIWVNLHGGFVYGLVLIGLFLAASVIERLRSGRDGSNRQLWEYASALGVSAVAALLNPWGWGVYRHIISMFGDRYIIDHTAEFLSPDFHDAGSKLFLLLLIAVLTAAFLSRRQAGTQVMLIVAAGMYFALVQQRNATLFGLTALPMLAIDLDPEWRSMRALRRVRTSFELGAAGAATRGWVAGAAMLAMALGLSHGRAGERAVISDAFNPEHQPVAAVNAARAARLQGHLFADFGWGGYLLYAWPEQKIFIDGGTDFFGGDLMRDYSTIRSVRPGWKELVQKWNISFMILSPDAPIASELTGDHQWSYWYCDSTAVVIVSPGSAASATPSPRPPRQDACAPDPTANPGAS